jgi:hypothetical protein
MALLGLSSEVSSLDHVGWLYWGLVLRSVRWTMWDGFSGA